MPFGITAAKHFPCSPSSILKLRGVALSQAPGRQAEIKRCTFRDVVLEDGLSNPHELVKEWEIYRAGHQQAQAGTRGSQRKIAEAAVHTQFLYQIGSLLLV